MNFSLYSSDAYEPSIIIHWYISENIEVLLYLFIFLIAKIGCYSLFKSFFKTKINKYNTKISRNF